MAQARTGTTRKGSGSQRSGRSTSRNGSGSRSRASSRSTSSRARSNSSRSRSTRSRSSPSRNGRSTTRASATRSKGTARTAAKKAQGGAQGLGERVSEVVDKAKVPLVAGGAALAGLAGAAVVSARSTRKRTVLGISMPKRSGFSLPGRSGFSLPGRNGLKTDARRVTEAVTDAAKRADEFGQRVSRVASSVQSVSETANEAVKKS